MDEHDITRKRIHELADSVQAVMVKTAVIEERQAHVVDSLARIEASVSAVATVAIKVAVLEDRTNEARDTAAKWGAALGAFVAAVISGISAIFGGGK